MTGSFRRYETGHGTMSYEDIASWCHAVRGSMRQAGLINPFAIYRSLISGLVAAGVDMRPLRAFHLPRSTSSATVYLRHDVDADVMAALEIARLLQEHGLVGSFYLLHTSQYYGEFREGVFHRQPGLARIVEELLGRGQEIGLHIDPLHLYLNLGIDGTEALLAELAWLRSRGATVDGVMAHNSTPVYGAENFEIFAEYAWHGRAQVERSSDGRGAPLGTLTLASAGLAYEGNFARPPPASDAAKLNAFCGYLPTDALRNRQWQESYFLNHPIFERENDLSAWIVGPDQWVIARHHPVRHLDRLMTTVETVGKLRSSVGERCIVAVHPEYVGDISSGA
jgi:hypothetical protein